jgi:hypothetical protein
MRKSRGTRLLGSIQVTSDEALSFRERQERASNSEIGNLVPYDCAACQLPFLKVNPDGPSLKLIATFSISNSTDGNGIAGIQRKI